MKSTQKGNLYEKEVKTILEAQGWMVEGQHRKVMWIRDKYTGEMKMIMSGRDIFGCDLIAKKQGERTRWIQVSTVTQKSSKQKQVLQFPWTLSHESVELWLRIDGKRAFRVFLLDLDNTFKEQETQALKRSKNEQENTDGTQGLTSEVASEYPE
jgi:hypothetical protein